mgnify:CR=1 FL=1
MRKRDAILIVTLLVVLAAGVVLLLDGTGGSEPLIPEEPRPQMPGRLMSVSIGDAVVNGVGVGLTTYCEVDARVVIRDGAVTRVREQGDRPAVKVGDRVANPPTQDWVGLDADVREVDFDLGVYWGADGLLHIGCAPESVIYWGDGRVTRVGDEMPEREKSDIEMLRYIIGDSRQVVVGTVVGLTGTIQHDFAGDTPGEPPVTIPYLSVTIQPVRWLWPKDMPVENTLTVLFPFGLERGEELVPGGTYLLFLADSASYGGPGLTSSLARFRVLDDGRIAPNAFVVHGETEIVSGVTLEEMLAAKSAPDPQAALMALGRLTIDEVAAKIEAAMAEGPPAVQTPHPEP